MATENQIATVAVVCEVVPETRRHDAAHCQQLQFFPSRMAEN